MVIAIKVAFNTRIKDLGSEMRFNITSSGTRAPFFFRARGEVSRDSRLDVLGVALGASGKCELNASRVNASEEHLSDGIGKSFVHIVSHSIDIPLWIGNGKISVSYLCCG